MTIADAAIVLQARMGSTRLPGKALASLGTTSLVVRCLSRLMHANAGPVVLATTTRAEDDRLAAAGLAAGARVYRGAADDVLGRYAAVAATLGVPLIVRATGDNPAVDVDSIVRLLAIARREDADHVVEVGLPYGSTVEVISARALFAASAAAVRDEDREHVTTFIRREGSGFRCLSSPAPASLCRPDLRFTVDTADDLAYMRQVFAGVAATDGCVATLHDLIAAADRIGPRSEAA